ncbi:hypothetical protein ABIB07_004519 [Bradyrhizobium sp. RT10b]
MIVLVHCSKSTTSYNLRGRLCGQLGKHLMV